MNRKFLNRILKVVLGGILRRLCRMEASVTGMDDIEPPYILLGNHTNFFDPFIVSYFLKDHVCFVASDEYFRNAVLRGLLKLVGAIPKAKFVSDSSAVREIMKLKEQKAAIGIYPEGTRTWNGRTEPVLYATARLVKSLGIPVVTALTSGGYLAFPRWARHRRKGKIHLDIRLLLTGEDIGRMSADEIHAAVSSALQHREDEWQRKNMIRFTGRNPAESLELYLHTCPSCMETGWLHSHNDRIECRKCNYSLKYNEYGFFEKTDASGKDAIFDNVGDWGEWQKKLFAERMVEWLNEDAGKPFLEQADTEVFEGGWRRRSFIRKNCGTLRLVNGILEFNGNRGNMTFDPRYMMGLVVNHKNKLDFFYRDRKLYRMKFNNQDVSGYLWLEALKLAKESRKNGRKLDTGS